MAEIHIHRAHRLGLAQARKVAWDWAEQAEQRFGLACSVLEGETSDTVEFSRTGVSGTLIVAPDHFELQARLGFLLSTFSQSIREEIESNLDQLLGAAAAAVAAKRTGARPRKPVAPKTTLKAK